MYYAANGIIPKKEWKHDNNIRNNYGQTVEMILNMKGVNIPKEWKVNYIPDIPP